MFARVKKSGKYQYLQIVENRREKGKVKQRVIATVGRLEKLQEKRKVENLVRSLSRFSENVLLVLSGKSDISAEAKKIGPVLIFERLWNETGIKTVLKKLLAKRKFEFDVERAIFLTVLHRLMVSGSDRFCDKWHKRYAITGQDGLELHHFYRAMAFLGEELADQGDATPFSPRCNKDLIEEDLFFFRRDMFTGLEMVFFDTTSIYFEGNGGQSLGARGFSKDHRPDLKQMVVGVVIDDNGTPVFCEMWPGNTADVKTLIPICDRMRKRFMIDRFCIVADRGMISAETMKALESPERKIPYILGARMRNVKEVRDEVLSRAGRYKEVRPEKYPSDSPAPLKVKDVRVGENRYVVCLNRKQAKKDAADRKRILDSLETQIKKGPKSFVGNKGYRKYVRIETGSMSIDMDKVKYESRFDGKWVLKTNTDMPADQVALKYKELWQVEKVFRDTKSLLETRPVFHQRDDTIRGHVFCSFLSLVLRKELERRLNDSGFFFEWNDIKQDLSSLQEVVIEEKGKQLAVRTQCVGTCGKVFKSLGIAIPPTIREV